MTKQQTLEAILDCGIVAIIRTDSAEKAAGAAAALARGGIRLIEVTMSVPGAMDVIRDLAARGGETVIGAGTILDAETAREALRNGAAYIVSPVFKPEIIAACGDDAVAIPGAMTPTEIYAAWEAGAPIVKVFPVRQLGVEFIKDVRAPLPQVRLMPTGGIDLENIGAYFRAGVAAVGVGGNLVDKKALATGDFDAVTEMARKYVAAVREAKGKA